MLNAYTGRRLAVAALLAAAGFSQHAVAATPAATPQISGAVDEGSSVALTGDAALSMHAVRDNGALAADAALEHLQLALKRSPERQAALDKLVADQTNPSSPSFHKWVDAAQFGSEFGPAASDVQATVAWLASHGLTVNSVAPNLMSIDFSGTHAQVKAAFKTELHEVVTADGESHMANVAAPSIPAALSGVVDGVTLSNFFPKPTLRKVGAVTREGATGKAVITKADPDFTFPYNSTTTFYAVGPSDFATIYNLAGLTSGSNPQFGVPITGKGVTLIVAEQTDIKPADWKSFRSAFGLSGYAGTLTIEHPNGCADPGFIADEDEAALDAEWSSAVAPDAKIVLAACAGTSPFNFGVMNTLTQLVNTPQKASAISISYGGCEAGNGLAFESMWTALVEQGAAEGLSIFVSAGDGSAAGCDNPGSPAAKFGIAANGLASSAYVTSAGGTDFSDTADGTNSLYWSSANGPGLSSALSYIPEIPWENSCASSVLYKYYGAPDAITFCNSAAGQADSQGLVGGGGAPSSLYAKPDWQPTSLKGVPNDGVRDQPDVSLFAANGIWNHFYIYCMSDASEGGVPCKYTNANDVLGSAAGGTSFVAPILAGIQALVVQVKGEKVGNMAPRLYQLAQLQYENALLVNRCKSNLGPDEVSTCVFNEITRGDNAVPCVKGSPNCYTNAESTMGVGVLSTSAKKEAVAYPAALGWNFATGLGSLNIASLVASY